MTAFGTTTESGVYQGFDGSPQIMWATSPFYRGRAHLAPFGSAVGLCGMPVDSQPTRLAGAVTCPECALAFVEATVPTMPLGWPDGRHQ